MKNIFKSLLLTAALVFGASAYAADSYLYWMLQDTQKDTPAAWTYAMVKVIGASEDRSAKAAAYLTSYDYAGVQKFGKESDGTYDYISSTLAMIGSEYLNNSYKFIVELYNGNELAAYSSAIMGDKIVAGSSVEGLTDNAFGGLQVPEPTSGMLALLGFGLLALRRKRI